MPATPDLSALQLVALPPAAIAALSSAGGDSVGVLRHAGHAGGEALADAFESWLGREHDRSAELSLDEFNERVAAFFGHAGWGALNVEPLYDVAVAVELKNCWEARDRASSRAPSCHFTTGALAAFFGRYAPEAMAAMEVECAAAGGATCRFLLGSADVLDAVYRGLESGGRYDDALRQLSAESTSL